MYNLLKCTIVAAHSTYRKNYTGQLTSYAGEPTLLFTLNPPSRSNVLQSVRRGQIMTGDVKFSVPSMEDLRSPSSGHLAKNSKSLQSLWPAPRVL